MSMTRLKIEMSISAAEAFIVRARQALAQLNREAEERVPRDGFWSSDDDYSYGSKATGSLRRQSMNLTRQLSELRR